MRQLQFEPDRLWHYFEEILLIPRASKKEERIAAWLMHFASEHGLDAEQDEIGNVLIRKDASPGMEDRKTVVLQSHIDMVCEKNSDIDHNFEKDPIIPRIDGEWVKATGTTLGADDGIGIATQLAILEAGDIEHGPVECLFTVDEETGLSGAFGLKPGFLRGEILLNLDSEDDGELFIGCAGGKDTVAEIGFDYTDNNHDTALSISVSGLRGGHSGDDIHKGYGNATKILARLVSELRHAFGVGLASFEAGNLRNAIAREGKAMVTCNAGDVDQILEHAVKFRETIRSEYRITEPGLEVRAEMAQPPESTVSEKDAARLIDALYACPHGVIAWSQDIPGFVETSTNLASVKMKGKSFEITTSQRSSVESAKEDICAMVASVFRLAGARVTHSDGYPGWSPNPDSDIVRITAESFRQLFNQEPKVLAIHAGLECGLIGEKYPAMDMISYGPTIKGAHSPDERLKIDTVKRFWDLTLDVLAKIPVA